MSKVIDEHEILEEFRKSVSDLKQNDEVMLRFLRARNHNPKAAEEMLRKACEWRQVNRIDSALTWHIKESVAQKLKVYYPGLDYKNRCIVYVPLGAWPLRELVEAGHKDEMLRLIYVTLERSMREIDKTGNDKCTVIIDQEGASLSTWAHYETMNLVFHGFHVFDRFYPERLCEAFAINIPFYIMYTWHLLRPLLSGNTISKTSIYGRNPDQYMPVLLSKMPPSSIPEPLKKYLKK